MDANRLIVVATVALSLLLILIFRYDLEVVGGDRVAAYKLNRITGTVTLIHGPKEHDVEKYVDQNLGDEAAP